MSSRKGDARKRGQRHQNSTAYNPNRYGETRQSKLAAATPLAGLCARCKEKIEWKRKYDKYKPLTAPKKCVTCQEKKVKQAYYRLCRECAESRGLCAKCGEESEIVGSFPMSATAQAKEEAEFRRGLKAMRERDRRKLLREQSKSAEETPQNSQMAQESECSEDSNSCSDTDEISREIITGT